jgi:arylsulfatase A-like enzyme
MAPKLGDGAFPRVRVRWHVGALPGRSGKVAGARGGLLGFLLLVAGLAGCGGEAGEPPTSPVEGVQGETGLLRGVVLVSMDTVRVDRLGFMGYERGTSPNLDGVASRSVVFGGARAQSTQTAPSHASILVSAYPGAHGIVNVHEGDREAPVLPPGVVTMAGHLSAAGVRTAAFVSGGNFTRTMEMDRGFEVWNERNEDVAGRVDGLLEWIGSVGSAPFLAVLHTYQAHAPYVPPAAEAARFTDPEYRGALRDTYERYLGLPSQDAWALGVGPDYWPPAMVDYSESDVRFLSDLYDGEIAYLDVQLRRVFESILLGDRAGDTAMVVLSDHGEEFRDHGKFQHDQVFDELARVPLVIHAGTALERKGWKGRVDFPVELVDVAPTVSELLGVAWKRTGWTGRSLVPFMDPATRPAVAREPQRPVFTELVRERRTHEYGAVTWQGWKYITHRQTTNGRTWEHLFDLGRDPLEQVNLIDSGDAGTMSRLQALREAWRAFSEANTSRAAELGRGEPLPLSEEQLLELKRLGYTGGPR